MWRLIGVFAIVSSVSLAGPAAAQTRAAGEADPGVRPTRLIDRAEIRVSRVEIQPGATRSVHTHDDVEYHVWVPLEGTLQLTVGSDPPVAANPGQAFFLKRGTPHGFKNVGTSAAAVMEIFVKQTAAGRGQDASAVAVELAQAMSIRRR
jgi:quercetin dioxygenase-like cupin family protein